MDKRKYYWSLGVIVAVLGVFGVYEFFKARAYKQGLEDTYNRAFFELTGYVDDIDTLLAKAMLVSSAGEMASVSQELSVQATAAKACLAQLPVSEIQLDKTEKFLSQVGDYTYTLSQSLIDRKTVSEQEYENLVSLGGYATSLNESLAELSAKVYSGKIHFGDSTEISLEKTAYAEEVHPLEAIEKEFGEYPSLIYDGPFSEHIENMKPKMTENERELTKEEAAAKAAEFFGVQSGKVKYVSETENSNMSSYLFGIENGKKRTTVSLTKRGGYVVYFLNDRNVRTEKIDTDEAIAKAKEYLKSKGFENMQSSYYDKNNGVATVNFAYKQNNVICYSDLIKVKVALDNGEIIGMEANGYIMNHTVRDIRTPALGKQEAREKVSKHLSIDSAATALIPKDSKREVLCYEFKGTANGRNFLIYINADTGKEEDIRILIEGPDGILTI